MANHKFYKPVCVEHIMRVKLESGAQRELLLSHKSKVNKTWSEIADSLNVSQSALRDWTLEKCFIPEDIFRIVDCKHNFKSRILEVLPRNWGQIKGGNASSGSLKTIKLPPESTELAEFIGIILGDGNIHTFKKGKKVGTYMVRICGHANDDRDFLLGHVCKLITDLFGEAPKVHKSSCSEALYITIHSKKLVEFLSNMGLVAGNKIKNRLVMPDWILANDEFLKACLRGLIDTDGSVFRMSRKDPNLARISFTNHNAPLLFQVREAFLKCGLSPSNIIRDEVFYLSRKSSIKKYVEDIGFSNLKHARRLSNIAP